MTLTARLTEVLGGVGTVVEEPDGALTVTVEGSVASLRVVAIAEDLELVSLTQPLAWDLPVTTETLEKVAAHTAATVLGTVALVQKPAADPEGNGEFASVADVMLRYNFPAAGLSEDALRTLILLVLAAGADVRRALLA